MSARKPVPALALVLGVVLAACGGTSPAASPLGRYVAGSPQLGDHPAMSCPADLGPARDVHNPPAGLRRQLVPTETPTAAEACVYLIRNTENDRTRPLRSKARLTTGAAATLARSVAHVSLAPLHATYACPSGSDEIIVLTFSYAHRPAVGLWFDRGAAHSWTTVTCRLTAPETRPSTPTSLSRWPPCCDLPEGPGRR